MRVKIQNVHYLCSHNWQEMLYNTSHYGNHSDSRFMTLKHELQLHVFKKNLQILITYLKKIEHDTTFNGT
jgi:hypothetical protein